ncbi:hypothetical protein SAMN04489802_2806 [Pseudomonas chlororaphis]|uniref:hypothetical protein n=1 Tax=Pseudomonas chlororaphis TaxID=587753 RepID=UPI0008794A21|nr:hypothetical protein [Pseudomonas chlororaphis]AZD67606.1 hypothetical protein C4K17_3720 [Pseudomonas chlororaphis subsp. aurantiaca]QIT23577.1 hypothetical protein HCN09_18205 [Pseudomonas chlororaphis subsp. aurantiaca]WDH01671.1 hypothetical protein PUP57_19330 [Pseudomonas chlororaphis]WDH09481.1 hypothetical protein PUP64_27680 [Pseudomonas chlororaphis]SDS97492.1 hypothetical protein SAMN04489802_2806 [Pseudomonas chlororaphis]
MSEQTLQQLLAERVSTYALSDRPRELIDEGIDKMFKSVVEDAFRSYGTIGESIKTAVKEAFPANVTDMFELQRYNALIANALRERWEAAGMESAIMKQADASITEVLTGEGLLTGEISLKDLLDAFIDEHKEEAADERWSAPEIRIIEDDSHSHKFYHIYFDPQPEGGSRYSYSNERRSDYSLKHNIHVMVEGERETGDHWRPKVEFGKVYSAQLDAKKVSIKMNIRSKWERILASLYFGEAVLLIDCEESDFSYGFDD